jgi:hypothetical protein
MKEKVWIIVAIVLVVLFVLAWRKSSVEKEVEPPVFNVSDGLRKREERKSRSNSLFSRSLEKSAHDLAMRMVKGRKGANTREETREGKKVNTREEKCREIFESLTGRTYPTTRPKWLRNPKTGRTLELDGYCEDLKSAFEYNGAQHYEFPNTYHKTEADFNAQLYRDAIKTKTCAEKGVALLVIPYDLEDDKLFDLIANHLGRLGII